MALQLGQRPVHVADAVDHEHGRRADQRQDSEVGQVGRGERPREPRDGQAFPVGREENHAHLVWAAAGRQVS